jgi:hypothetical protein
MPASWEPASPDSTEHTHDSIRFLGAPRGIVHCHVEAENRHDIEATIATLEHPRYEFDGVPADGAAAVRELLQTLMRALPDLHASIDTLRHTDDAVIFGPHHRHTRRRMARHPTHRPTHRAGPGVAIFEFDEDRLICEKVFMDTAVALTQMGVLPT